MNNTSSDTRRTLVRHKKPRTTRNVPSLSLTTANLQQRRTASPTTSSSSSSSSSNDVTVLTQREVKKLSTERSRLCRQRQKHYAESLASSVRALELELADLRILRDLHREQLVATRSSPSGSLARIVREYCTVFQHGIPPDVTTVVALAGSSSNTKKRSFNQSIAIALTPQAQRDFMYSVMDPNVQVFDWVGRAALGCQPLLNGWEAWSHWHDAFEFRVQSMDVIDADDVLAVRTNGTLRGVVTDTTLRELFPFAASDETLRQKLLGRVVVYRLHDTFYFSSDSRVVKYTVDIDFVGALTALVGDYADVLKLLAPPNQTSFNDLAIRTLTTTGVVAATDCSSSTSRSRLDVQFLLS